MNVKVNSEHCQTTCLDGIQLFGKLDKLFALNTDQTLKTQAYYEGSFEIEEEDYEEKVLSF